MESAFGVDHGISKGLPSAIKAGGGGAYGALRRTAKEQGKVAGQEKLLMRTKKPGWTTHQYQMNTAHRAGSFAAGDARTMIKKPR